MDFKLRDGDYVPDGRGGFVTVSGDEETLQRALLRLTVRKGGLPFRPEFGSRFYTLFHCRPGRRTAEARHLANEALAEEAGVLVEDVRVEESGGGLELTVWLTAGDRSATAEVSI